MKEEDQFKEKNKSKNMQKEIEKLQTKLNDCNEYIGSLPTSEEFKEKENQIEQLKTDFASLQAKLVEKEKQNKRAKEYIRDKMSEVKQLQEKLDAANMETERIRIQFETYREETKEVGDLLDVREEKSRIVAENEVNKKCIIALHENQKNLTTKYESQLNEYKDKLKYELDTIKTFEKKLENKETEISKLENSVKKVANENQILMEENLNLKDNLNTLDTAMSAETLKFLYKLFEELNGCTLELNNLVKNCIDLHKGKQVEIDSLLGCVKSCNYFILVFFFD
jgi:chromosome segregation ATPase